MTLLQSSDTDFYTDIYTILPKVLAPLLMNRFDYFSNFYEVQILMLKHIMIF